MSPFNGSTTTELPSTYLDNSSSTLCGAYTYGGAVASAGAATAGLQATLAALQAAQLGEAGAGKKQSPEEQAELWGQVQDQRRLIDELSRQLQALQEVARPADYSTKSADATQVSASTDPGSSSRAPLTGGDADTDCMSPSATPPRPPAPHALLEACAAAVYPVQPRAVIDPTTGACVGDLGPSSVDGQLSECASWPYEDEAAATHCSKEPCPGALPVERARPWAAGSRGRGGARGGISQQLSTLKAQMAAVEKQGETLRATTHAVEEECKRMAALGAGLRGCHEAGGDAGAEHAGGHRRDPSRGERGGGIRP